MPSTESLRSERCRFCSLADVTAPSENTGFRVSRGVDVLPSWGALVPGWILVVSEEHVSSSAQLARDARRRLFDAAQRIGRQMFGSRQRIIFEHGAASSASAVACTTAHVHLHVVPIDGDVLGHAKTYFPLAGEWHKQSIDTLGELAEEDYLLFLSGNESPVAKALLEPTSQYFRRVIADLIGRPTEWDWKQYPQADAVAETYTQLKSLSAAARVELRF